MTRLDLSICGAIGRTGPIHFIDTCPTKLAVSRAANRP
jgi:hypothetical protein